MTTAKTKIMVIYDDPSLPLHTDNDPNSFNSFTTEQVEKFNNIAQKLIELLSEKDYEVCKLSNIKNYGNDVTSIKLLLEEGKDVNFFVHISNLRVHRDLHDNRTNLKIKKIFSIRRSTNSFIGGGSISVLPDFEKEFFYYDHNTPEDNAKYLADAIDKQIYLILHSEAQKQEADIVKEKAVIEAAGDYIKETIEKIEEKEKDHFKIAKQWYRWGYLSIFAGVLALIGLNYFFGTLDSKGEYYWVEIIIWSIKGIVITVLFISMSKYAFKIAKSYMDVSIKYSDRHHAIRFGHFFVKAFSSDLSKDDLKDVFQNWNVDSSNKSAFFHTDSNDHDPKIFENLNDTFKTLTGLISSANKDTKETKFKENETSAKT